MLILVVVGASGQLNEHGTGTVDMCPQFLVHKAKENPFSNEATYGKHIATELEESLLLSEDLLFKQ